MFSFFVAEDDDECLKKSFCFALLMEINGFTHKSSSSIEDFQVEDLLDLTGLSEPEKEEKEENLAKNELEFSAFEKEKTCSSQLYEITFYEETEEADLEWLSRFIEDCNTYEYSGCNFTMKQTPSLLRAAYHNHKRKKRSKRHRRSSGLWSVPGTSPVSSLITTTISSSSPSCSCSSSSSYMFYDPFPSPSNPFPSPSIVYMPKKRGRKPKLLAAASGCGGSSGERRCVHCGVQKTPQWRTGPNGPKTLCNACGVRFKSGRLLPEYRPACSPTFVGNVHSNSHRKVLEMRRKKEVQLYSDSAPAVQSC